MWGLARRRRATVGALALLSALLPATPAQAVDYVERPWTGTISGAGEFTQETHWDNGDWDSDHWTWSYTLTVDANGTTTATGELHRMYRSVEQGCLATWSYDGAGAATPSYGDQGGVQKIWTYLGSTPRWQLWEPPLTLPAIEESDSTGCPGGVLTRNAAEVSLPGPSGCGMDCPLPLSITPGVGEPPIDVTNTHEYDYPDTPLGQGVTSFTQHGSAWTRYNIDWDAFIDGDNDADGVTNAADNCPNDYNPQQQDTDHDGKGDACDIVVTWRVLPRMDDVDGDGILDHRYVDGRLSDPLAPNQPLDVVLDACPAADVTWSVDGQAQAAGGSCNLTVPLAEGTHTVSASSPDAGSTTVTIDPEHLMIVGLGDSYGSGEGVPAMVRKNGNLAPQWDQKACHRSRYSAQAQAALRLEQADETSAVTFLHLACSGATTFKGVLGEYPDPPGGGIQRAQVVAAREVTTGNPVDATLLSLGGNDIGFAPIITECIVSTDCPTHKKDGKTLHARTQKKLVNAEAGYDTTNACLTTVDQSQCPAPTWLPVPSDRVYVTEYPSLGRDSNGDYCKNIMGGFSAAELKWATQVVQDGRPGTTWNFKGKSLSIDNAGINQLIRSLAAVPGHFTPVTGIFDASRRHGYCAKEPWVVRLVQSFDTQGDKNGAMHPNRAGQEAFGRIIFEKVSADVL